VTPWGSASGGAGKAAWRRRLEDAVGEDPVRFLDADLVVDDDARELVLARIDGLARVDRVNAWLAAERRLGNPDDAPYREACPRQAVVQRLLKRREYLEDQGERPRDIPAALDADPRSVPDRFHPIPVGESNGGTATFVDEDGREYERVEKHGRTTVRYLEETVDDRAVADGGDRR
jgi:hypothetical protein